MTDMKVPAAFYFSYRPQMQSEAEEAMTSRPPPFLQVLPTGDLITQYKQSFTRELTALGLLLTSRNEGIKMGLLFQFPHGIDKSRPVDRRR